MPKRKRVKGLLVRDQGKKRKKVVSLKTRRKVIREYHAVLKECAQARARGDETAVTEATAKLQDAGGLAAYQDASLLGAAGVPAAPSFDSPSWVCSKLCKLGLIVDNVETPIRLLDVGAITNGYRGVVGIEATAIDLHAHDESVVEADFLSWTPPAASMPFDVVVLSLVLNFAGDPRARGAMLVKARQLVSDEGGLVIVVLPTACFENSRYMTRNRFEDMTAALGLAVAATDNTARLSMYVLRVSGPMPRNYVAFPRKLVLSGNHRNNFCIILQSLSRE